ncbi:MAG: Na/Pi cotransporter family protein [Lachnospiraceae bacterium]|nr:Na/Pi cotransporter family protein [Lachnospiraceae bacterium]
MQISELIDLFCGLAFFLFGMSLMGDGLKKASGNKLELILYKLSSTKLRGMLLGTGVTAVIQSSSATAVMVVGFVNSGMMNVTRGINVIIGAVLGTSITGWVICLSYIEGGGGIASILSTATLTGTVAVAGILCRMIGKKSQTRNIGDIMIGFAILMVGMSKMSGSVSSLGKQPWFTGILTSLSSPFIGILIGIAFTALLQSASASVGILQALSVTGAITFDSAFPLLIGITTGAAVPVLLSSVGANTSGKRTAWSYPISTALGSMFAASLFYIAEAIIRFPFFYTVMNPFSMALVNTVLRLAMLLLLYPFTDIIEALINALIKENKEAAPGFRLEERFIHHPALAIEQSRITINDMARSAMKALNESFTLFDEYSEEKESEIRSLENVVDGYEDALGSYLVKLTGQEMNREQNEEISKFLHTLSDFERISDHALNLAESAKEVHDKALKFSTSAGNELKVLGSALRKVVSIAVDAFIENDLSLAEQVEPLEELIDNLCDQMKLNHINRLQREECTITQGFIFNDIITVCERVSDHCSNIAVAMIELGDDSFDTHEYLNNIRSKRGPEFQEYYNNFKEEFTL